MSGNKTLICCPFPNPNGNIHLGHLAGPFLSADIQLRYRRMIGHEVYLLGGTDDYQSWTNSMAEQLGEDPATMAARNNRAIQESCRSARIEMDHFHQPSASALTDEVTRELVAKLFADGHIVPRETIGYFCADCSRYLFDVYINGICPSCGATACGASCEACGRPHDAADLIDPVCLCGKKPTAHRVQKLYFPLAPHRERLETYYESLTTNVYQESLWRKLLEGGLPELPASQFGDWGVPLSINGFENQRFSPWLQMTADHLAASRELSEKVGSAQGWQTFWQDESTEGIHFCGPDTGWIFGVLYPAVLEAYAPTYRSATAVFVTQFYNLEDRIFSTSQRHAIWVSDLATETSADAVRFYCAATSPEVEQTTFRGEQFHRMIHEELIGRWEGWLRELGTKVAEGTGGSAPQAGPLDARGEDFVDRLRGVCKNARSAYEIATYSPQGATRAACELVRLARSFGKAADYLKQVRSAREQWLTAVALELRAARLLALLMAPLMPDFSEHLWQALGYGTAVREQGWEDLPEFVPAGQSLRDLGVEYFPRVEETSFVAPKPAVLS